MNTHYRPKPPGEASPAAQAQYDLGGFEERLLTELKSAVAQQSVPLRPVIARNVRHRRGRAVAAGMPSSLLRPALAGAAAVAAAGGVAVAAVMALGAPATRGAGSTAAAGSHTPAGQPAFGPATTAAGVLQNAALAALELPAGAPRPDQFVYSRVVRNWPGLGVPLSEQQWISAHGTRPGLDKITGGPKNPPPGQRQTGTMRLPFCRHGLVYDPALRHYRVRPVHCTADQYAGYLPGMPTSPGALRPYLLRLFALPNDPGNTGALLSSIERMMTTDYLLPQQRAALYEFLAHLPDLKVAPHVANMQGTVGIGVRVGGYKGGDWTVIFNPKTYAPLGMNWTRLGHQHAGEIQVGLAIVSKAGQLP